MVFSSLFFLFKFFPAAVLLYFLAPGIKCKNIVLTALSLVFYAWGEPVWVILLIISAAVDYTNGLIIERFRGRCPAAASLAASVVINLLLLGTFKYGGFIIANLNLLPGINLPVPGISLPIGISFYTFQTMSYSIDLYRNKIKVQKSFLDFLMYVSLFPQLIAGPIVRYADIETQIRERGAGRGDFAAGISRFVCGLGKKVLLSNYASAAMEKLLTPGIAGLTVSGAWLCIVMFTFHIYFDFSGYSDMAIGLGRMFGFHFPENFRYPYVSESVGEFWRRWHITLSSFFRDFVYIPLGGNQKRQVFNMLAVWALTGLWHGASWNFVLWGLYYFVLLTAEKYLFRGLAPKIPGAVRIVWTFILTLMGWVLFHFISPGDALSFYRALFGLSGNPFSDAGTRLTLVNSLPLLAVCVAGATPLLSRAAGKFKEGVDLGRIPYCCYPIAAVTYNSAVFALCVVSLLGATHNPFIYFRF